MSQQKPSSSSVKQLQMPVVHQHVALDTADIQREIIINEREMQDISLGSPTSNEVQGESTIGNIGNNNNNNNSNNLKADEKLTFYHVCVLFSAFVGWGFDA